MHRRRSTTRQNQSVNTVSVDASKREEARQRIAKRRKVTHRKREKKEIRWEEWGGKLFWRIPRNSLDTKTIVEGAIGFFHDFDTLILVARVFEMCSMLVCVGVSVVDHLSPVSVVVGCSVALR